MIIEEFQVLADLDEVNAGVYPVALVHSLTLYLWIEVGKWSLGTVFTSRSSDAESWFCLHTSTDPDATMYVRMTMSGQSNDRLEGECAIGPSSSDIESFSNGHGTNRGSNNSSYHNAQYQIGMRRQAPSNWNWLDSTAAVDLGDGKMTPTGEQFNDMWEDTNKTVAWTAKSINITGHGDNGATSNATASNDEYLNESSYEWLPGQYQISGSEISWPTTRRRTRGGTGTLSTTGNSEVKLTGRFDFVGAASDTYSARIGISAPGQSIPIIEATATPGPLVAGDVDVDSEAFTQGASFRGLYSFLNGITDGREATPDASMLAGLAILFTAAGASVFVFGATKSVGIAMLAACAGASFALFQTPLPWIWIFLMIIGAVASIMLIRQPIAH